MNRLASLGEMLGRGGIPPTPPFRRALVWAGKFFGKHFPFFFHEFII